MQPRRRFPFSMRERELRACERERERSDPGLPAVVAGRLAGRRAMAAMRRRTPLDVARAEARRCADALTRLGAEVVLCGSASRDMELVGDVDLAVIASQDLRPVFADLRRESAAAVDFRVASPSSRGALLAVLRGPAEFSEALKVIAEDRGFRLHNNCLTRDGAIVETATEDDVFRLLGLPFVPHAERPERLQWVAELRRRLG